MLKQQQNLSAKIIYCLQARAATKLPWRLGVDLQPAGRRCGRGGARRGRRCGGGCARRVRTCGSSRCVGGPVVDAAAAELGEDGGAALGVRGRSAAALGCKEVRAELGFYVGGARWEGGAGGSRVHYSYPYQTLLIRSCPLSRRRRLLLPRRRASFLPPPRPKPRPSATIPPSLHRHSWPPAGLRVHKMQRTKRKGRGKNIARLNKRQNASKALLKQCGSCGNSWSELPKQIESKLSESVVSLASFDGDTFVSECTGILIENLSADTTTILTSANLIGSSDDGYNEKLTIKVRLPNNRVVIGSLGSFDSKYDLAVVKIRRARGFQEAHLSCNHHVQFESNSSKVVAMGRCFDSGMLSFTDGTLIGPASYGIRQLILSPNKMNTTLNGCPLIDVDGNFVGVYFRRGKKTAFVLMNKILDFLGYSGTTRHSAADTDDKRGSNSPSAADTNDKRGLNSPSAADTNDKRGLNSWSLLFPGIADPEVRDLELFRLDKIVFYHRELDQSRLD